MNKETPSQEYLKECFDYDLSTGHLAWKTRPLEHFKDVRSFNIWNTRFAGATVGTTPKNGRVQVGIDKVLYRAHRVIWKLVYGVDPIEVIDHKDCDPANNKLSNLRLATVTENNRNVLRVKTNTSGYKGVYVNATGYINVQLRVGGNQRVTKGGFKTIADAIAYRDTQIKKYHGEFANNGT